MLAKTTKNNKKTIPPHAKIPHADMEWALQQSPTVLRLWIESWRADSFGSSPTRRTPQWHILTTQLQGDNLRKAKKNIEDAGLFRYEPINEKSKAGQWKIVGWKVLNLHGHYSGYWGKPIETSESIPRGYKKFLQTEYWQQVREMVFERDKHCCKQCNTTKRLQVHHLSYKHHRDEMNHIEDLITLCRDCHQEQHFSDALM